MSTYVAGIRSVRTRGERTVEVRTAAPVGILLNKLRFILVVRRGEETGTLARHVNGTGPYRLASWEPGRSMSFAENPTYWGPKPALGKVSIALNRSADVALHDFLSGRSLFV